MESEAIRLFDVLVGVMIPVVGAGIYYIVQLLIRVALVEAKLGDNILEKILESQEYANSRLQQIEHHLDLTPPKRH